MTLQALVASYSGNLYAGEHEAELQYFRDRGLTDDTVTRFRLGWSTEFQGYSIPYLSATGKPVMVKVRRAADSEARYKYITEAHDFPLEQRTHLFNVAAVLQPSVVIAEGEFDAMILEQCGIPAVAVPGASTWHESWTPLIPGDAVIAFDGDSAGREGAEKLLATLSTRGRAVRLATLPDGYDITDLYLAEGCEAVKELIASGQ